MRRDTAKEQQPTRSTAGELLPDGGLLEIIRDPADPGRITMLRWDGNRAEVADCIECFGRTYVPIAVADGMLEAVCLPSLPENHGSTAELFARIVGVIGGFFDFPDRDLHLLAHWVLSTWFPDFLPMAITLVISSSSPPEASRLFRLLKCVCRRGLRLGELNPAGLFAMPMQLRPTLLLEQMGLTRSMCRLLKASSNRGLYFARSGNFLDLHCAKAVSFSALGDLDATLAEGMLRVAVVPTESRSVMLNERDEDRITAEFQPLLLDYRLHNYVAVKESALDVPEFTPELRDLARSLRAAVAGDGELANEIVALLAPQDEDARARRSARPECAIAVVLLALVHEKKERELLVKDITCFVNAALRANGEIVEFSPEEIGWRLAELGLYTRRMKGGRGIRFDRELSRSVHALARRLGVSVSPPGFPACPDCEQAVKALDPEVVV